MERLHVAMLGINSAASAPLKFVSLLYVYAFLPRKVNISALHEKCHGARCVRDLGHRRASIDASAYW